MHWKKIKKAFVITSYSIHYTKLYEIVELEVPLDSGRFEKSKIIQTEIPIDPEGENNVKNMDIV